MRKKGSNLRQLAVIPTCSGSTCISNRRGRFSMFKVGRFVRILGLAAVCSAIFTSSAHADDGYYQYAGGSSYSNQYANYYDNAGLQPATYRRSSSRRFSSRGFRRGSRSFSRRGFSSRRFGRSSRFNSSRRFRNSSRYYNRGFRSSRFSRSYRRSY